MGLYKRGQVWWMSFSYRGQQLRKPCETTSKKVAEKIYFKVKTEIAEGKWLDIDPGMDRTFLELMERYYRERSPKKSVKSYARDRSIMKHLNGYFGDYLLSQVTPKVISPYKELRREEGAAPATINHELGLMSAAFNLAMKEWEWVNSNPVSRVSKEKVNNLVERWLSVEEEKELLQVSPVWLREIILIAANTGLRMSEILGLSWDRVNLFNKTIRIVEQKNGCRDTLPLNMTALEVLKSRNKVRQIKNKLVFYGHAGTEIDQSNLRRSFNQAIEDAGIEKLRFHDLRHTFATRLIQNGVDIYTVQKLGRWKTIQMVERYAHHYAESLRGGLETLDSMNSDFITILSQSN